MLCEDAVDERDKPDATKGYPVHKRKPRNKFVMVILVKTEDVNFRRSVFRVFFALNDAGDSCHDGAWVDRTHNIGLVNNTL